VEILVIMKFEKCYHPATFQNAEDEKVIILPVLHGCET
jgi:hypothetical protein